MSFELILPFLRPIEGLLLDDSISEIMGNPDASWWCERDGKMHHEDAISFDAAKLLTSLEVIANQLGKKLDEDNPSLHAQLPDGSRLAAWIPPIVRPSPALAIRKFTSRQFTIDDLVSRGTLTHSLADFLGEQIACGRTLLISGGTGTGKTTLLRILADFIPDHERIVVIEDTPELHIRKPNIVAAGSQTNTFKTHVSFDDLLKDALRFRPDRIILGEVRGVEARTLLDSFNTGHSGSLATIYANSAEKALCRFANLVMRGHAQTTFSDTEAEIAEAVDFVVHVERQPERRTVREVLRLNGYDANQNNSDLNSNLASVPLQPQGGPLVHKHQAIAADFLSGMVHPRRDVCASRSIHRRSADSATDHMRHRPAKAELSRLAGF
jgi:pilus assembly protein CpaF